MAKCVGKVIVEFADISEIEKIVQSAYAKLKDRFNCNYEIDKKMRKRPSLMAFAGEDEYDVVVKITCNDKEEYHRFSVKIMSAIGDIYRRSIIRVRECVEI